MSTPPAEFREGVSRALAKLTAPSLAARFAAPLVTALVADAREDARTDEALAEVIAALISVGLRRGRMYVLLGLGSEVPNPGPARLRAAALAASLGVPVLLHDPSGPVFTVGRLDGMPIALDDELREAEAIVSVGVCDMSAGALEGGPFLLCPGVAAATTRASFASAKSRLGASGALSFATAVERLAPVDLAVWWSRGGEASAASGQEAIARAVLAADFRLTLPKAST